MSGSLLLLTHDVGQSTGALTPKCGLFTGRPFIEARGGPEVAQVGKDVIEGEVSLASRTLFWV